MCSKYKHHSELDNEQNLRGPMQLLKEKNNLWFDLLNFLHLISNLKSCNDNMHDLQLTHWMRKFPIQSDTTGAIICEVKSAHNRATNIGILPIYNSLMVYMARFAVKSRYPKDKCHKKIGLYAQNINTIPNPTFKHNLEDAWRDRTITWRERESSFQPRTIFAYELQLIDLKLTMCVSWLTISSLIQWLKSFVKLEVPIIGPHTHVFS